jgi:hypothetical protein
MRAVVYGALLLSAQLDASLLRRHCRIKNWQYSLVDIQVFVCDMVDGVACCICFDKGNGDGAMCWIEEGALLSCRW